MNKIFLFFLLLACSSSVYSHEWIAPKDSIRQINKHTTTTRKVISTKVIKTRDHEFNENIVYDKKTGEKISPGEFRKIIKENPRVRLGKVYNEKGEIEKYLLDREPPTGNITMSNHQSNGNGNVFPDFVFRTIDNQKIRLSDLAGKTVIIRCEVSPGGPSFREAEIKNLEASVSRLKKKADVLMMIVFRSSKKEILANLDAEDYHSAFVPDGMGFFIRNNIKRYPSTLVIDKNGKLVNTYYHSRDIDLPEILEQTNTVSD